MSEIPSKEYSITADSVNLGHCSLNFYTQYGTLCIPCACSWVENKEIEKIRPMVSRGRKKEKPWSLWNPAGAAKTLKAMSVMPPDHRHPDKATPTGQDRGR